MIIPGDIGTLIDFFGFTASIFYCAAMVALIVMRFTKKNEHRPIKVRTRLVCLTEGNHSLLIW
jgi:L-type amino acid transporter 9